jgi:hypothetical protein
VRLSIRAQRGDLAAPWARRICTLADMAVWPLMIPLGTPAPDFALPDLAGTTVRRDDFAAAPSLLVMFLCNHCPSCVTSRPS